MDVGFLVNLWDGLADHHIEGLHCEIIRVDMLFDNIRWSLTIAEARNLEVTCETRKCLKACRFKIAANKSNGELDRSFLLIYRKFHRVNYTTTRGNAKT